MFVISPGWPAPTPRCCCPAGRGLLATDSRYTLAAERDCPDLELIEGRFIEPLLAGEMTKRGLGRVLFEAQEMTVERYEGLVAAAGTVTYRPFGHVVEDLRMVKDDTEIELLATACRISCKALRGRAAADQARADRTGACDGA